MCGGGGKGPPPPPDYTSQKTAFAGQQEAKYRSQADRYNTAAKAYNENLNSFGNKLSSFTSQLNGLTIKDSDKIDSIYGGLQGLLDEADNAGSVSWSAPPPSSATPTGGMSFGGAFGGINFGGGFQQPVTQPPPSTPETLGWRGILGLDIEKPNFSSVVMTPYGGESVQVNLPDLVNPNTQLGQQYMTDLKSALSRLDQLRTERTSELDRVNRARTGFSSTLSDLSSQLGGLKFSDTSALNSINSALGGIDAQRRGFSSALGPVDWGDIETQIGGLREKIGSLTSQRTAEEQRIKDYQASLYGKLDSARSGLQGAGLKDLDRITALDSEIDAAARDARRFSSLLPVDFSGALSEYNDVNSQIDRLYQQRDAEQARIRGLETDLLDFGSDARVAAAGIDPLDWSSIQQLRSQLAQYRARAGGFTSDLSFDLSQELPALDQADAALQELLAGRANALGTFRSAADRATTGISDIPLQNESVLRSRLQQLQAGLSELSQYQGSDLAPMRQQYMTAINDINARLGDLTNKRGDIASQARTLAREFGSKSFANKDEIEAARARLLEMQDLADQFGAAGAGQSLESIVARLSAEQKRLDDEAASVAARNEREQQDAIRSQSGFGGLLPYSSVPMTADQYSAFLARRTRRPDTESAFARALGA